MQHTMTLLRKTLLGISLLLAALMVMTTALPARAEAPQQTTNTIFEELQADNRFDLAVLALQNAGLDDEFDDPNATYTLFAPINQAWTNLPNDIQAAAISPADAEEEALLEYILLFHALDVELDLSNDTGATAVRNDTLLGSEYYLVIGTTDALKVHGAEIADNEPIETVNGFIYPIENVIIPPNRPEDFPGVDDVTVDFSEGVDDGLRFYYTNWDGDGAHSMGAWYSHYWDSDIEVEWDEYAFPDGVNGAYRMTIRIYSLLAGGSDDYYVIKEAYHWQQNPRPTTFVFGALGDGEPLLFGHPAYVVIEPATYTVNVDAMTGFTTYEYSLVEGADPQWSDVFSWQLPEDEGTFFGLYFFDFYQTQDLIDFFGQVP